MKSFVNDSIFWDEFQSSKSKLGTNDLKKKSIHIIQWFNSRTIQYYERSFQASKNKSFMNDAKKKYN